MSCLNETYLSNDLLSDLNENNKQTFKLNKSILLNQSKIDFRKNWSEMINENNLNENIL
jgi:hypothetical protein